MAERLRVVVTGLIGSGKTTIARHYRDAHGCEYVNVGDELKRLLQLDSPGSRPPRESYQAKHQAMRKIHPKYFAELVTPPPEVGRHVVDGLRNLADIRHYQAHGGVVLGVVARQEVRAGRINERLESKDGSGAEEVLAYERSEFFDADPDGMQLIPALWLAEDRILDTSDMTEEEMIAAAEDMFGLPHVPLRRD